MRNRLASALSVSTLSLLLVAGIGAAAPASAATSKDCKGKYLCLYDDANYRGELKKVKCGSYSPGLGKMSGRATSVINKCDGAALLSTVRRAGEGPSTKLHALVKPQQWTNLGGSVKMDNRVTNVVAPR